MRISSINGYYGRYNAECASKPKNQNFGGLWGKTSISTDIDQVFGCPTTNEERYYYPFSDEKKEDIRKILEARRKAEIIHNSKYVVHDCRLGMRLPCTRQEYEDYMKLLRRKRDPKIEMIHAAVLDKYLTDDYGTAQTSRPAYNRAIDKQAPERLFD